MASNDATAVSNAPPVRVGQVWRLGHGAQEWTLVGRVLAGMFTGQWKARSNQGSRGIISNRDLANRDAVMLLDAPPAVSPPDVPTWWYCEPCDVRVASSLTHVCKPPAPAKAPDRSGCKAFCGMTYDALGMGRAAHVDSAERIAWREARAFPDHKWTGDNPYGKQTWCSAVCRDASLPPVEAKAPGKRKSKCVEMCEVGTCVDCDREFREAEPATTAPTAQQAKGLECQVCHARNETVLVRVTRQGRAGLCERCMVNGESEAQMGMALMGGSRGAPTRILRDPKRPELLPRARLAVDWFDDCLPEAGR